MSVLLKLICIFSTIPIITPSQLFLEIDKQIVKHIWKCEGPGRAKTILEKRTTLEDLYYFFISVLIIRLQLATLYGVKMHGWIIKAEQRV